MRKFKHISTITADKRAGYDHYPEVTCVGVCSFLSHFFMGSLKMSVLRKWVIEVPKAWYSQVPDYPLFLHLPLFLHPILWTLFIFLPLPLSQSLSTHTSLYAPQPLPQLKPTPHSLHCSNLIGVWGSRCPRQCAMAERLRLGLVGGPTMCCPAGTTLVPYAGHCRVAWGLECSGDGR